MGSLTSSNKKKVSKKDDDLPSLNPREVSELNRLKISTDDVTFINEYIATGDAGKAYQSAFKCDPRTAKNLGSQMVRRPQIQRALSIFYSKLGENLIVNQQSLIAKLWEIINSPSSSTNEVIKAISQANAIIAAAAAEKDRSDGSRSTPMVNLTINTAGQPEVKNSGPKKVGESKPEEFPTINLKEKADGSYDCSDD